MSKRSSRTCLVIKNDGIGDLVLSSGLIASLATHYEGGLDLVICEECREIAALIPGVREVIPVSRDGLRFRNRPSKLRILIPTGTGVDRGALLTLKNRKYDDAICLRRFIRQSSLVLMRAVRSKGKFCAWQFPTNAPQWMVRREVRGWTHLPGDLATQPELSYLAGFVERVLGETVDSSPRLDFGREGTPCRDSKVAGFGIAGASSRWPAGYWVDFARKVSNLGWSIIIFGGPGDRETASWIVDAVPSAIDLVGALSWSETFDHLTRIGMFVGNDTGLSHLAALVVPHNLVVHGGGTFGRFFPWPGADNQYIIYHALRCFDCDWHCDYRDQHCIDLVHSNDVFRYFLDITEDPSGTSRMRNLAAKEVKYPIARRYVGDIPMQRTIGLSE